MASRTPCDTSVTSAILIPKWACADHLIGLILRTAFEGGSANMSSSREISRPCAR